jgi:hypothetical protein
VAVSVHAARSQRLRSHVPRVLQAMMSRVLSRAAAVLRDAAIAYAGGLVVGAPPAVASVWITGHDRLVPPLLLLGMAGVWLAKRRRAARPVSAERCAPKQREGCPVS